MRTDFRDRAAIVVQGCIDKQNYIPDPNIGTTTRQPLLMADSCIRRIRRSDCLDPCL